MSRFDRFLKLERARPKREDKGAGPAARERFLQPDQAVKASEPLAAPRASGAETDRFAAAPELEEKPIAVLADDGGQPFIRCRQCRTDNYLTATTCSLCHASLTTPPQRAYNEALWAQHTAEKAELQTHVQALEASRQAAEEEAQEALRRSHGFELLPRDQDRESEPPLGLRLARQIRDPRLRLLVLVAAAGLPVYLIFFTRGGTQRFGVFLCMVIALLFRPVRLRRWIRGGTWTIER